MTKIYATSNDGERYITTDAKDLDTFEREFARLIIKVISQGDEDHALMYLIPYAFRIAFKLAGYKSETVREKRVLAIGDANVDDEEIIASYESSTGKEFSLAYPPPEAADKNGHFDSSDTDADESARRNAK